MFGLVLTYFSVCYREGEKNRRREGIVFVVNFHCDEQQEPSAEGQMHVVRPVLSKDMMAVQKLIARTSKQEETQRAC